MVEIESRKKSGTGNNRVRSRIRHWRSEELAISAHAKNRHMRFTLVSWTMTATKSRNNTRLLHNGDNEQFKEAKHFAVCVVINVDQDAGRRKTMGDAPQRIVQLIVFSMEEGGPLLFLGNRPDAGPNPANKSSFSATVSSQKPGIVPES